MTKLVLAAVAVLVALQLAFGVAGSIRGSVGGPSGPCNGRPAEVHPTFTVSAANLVQNSSFETDTSGWSTQSPISRDPCFAKFGSASLRIGANPNGSIVTEYGVPISGAETAGREYEASMWIYVPPGSGLVGKEMGLQVGEDDVSYRTAAHIVLRVGWQRLHGMWALTQDGGTNIDLGPLLTGARPQDFVYVDGVSLEAAAGPCDGQPAEVHPAFPESAANLVDNSSFEEYSVRWSTQSPVVRDPCFAKFGSASLRIGGNPNGSIVTEYAVPISGSITAGRRYSASMWVYVPPASGLVGKEMGLQFGEDDAYYRITARIVLRPGWQLLAGDWALAQDAHSNISIGPVVLTGARPHDFIHIDGVSLEAVAGPCDGRPAEVHPTFTASAGNLVQNSSFETDTSGWSTQSPLSRDPCFAKFGSASLRIGGNPNGSIVTEYAVPISGSITAGRRYSASMWVYVPPGSNLIGSEIGLQFGEDDAYYRIAARIVLRPGWQLLAGNWALAQDAHSNISIGPVVFTGARPHDFIYIDGVTLEAD